VDKKAIKELERLAGGERTALIKALMSADLPEDSAVARHEDESKKLVLPRSMSLKQGWSLLQRTEEDLKKGQHAIYEIDAHYNDMLVALDKAIKKIFGFGMLQEVNMGMFGTIPPREETIQIGLNRLGNPKTIRVPGGRIALPGLFGQDDKGEDVGYLDVAHNEDKTKGAIRAYVRKQHMGLIDNLVEVTRVYLMEESIYQGQILDSQYNFLNLKDFNPDSLVLAEDTEKALDAFVLTPIRQPELADSYGIERNRAGLFYGVYGTGKTMAMKACAIWANREGWTSIIARPGDSVVDLINFGRQYQPALITVEDIDDQGGGKSGRTESLNDILNTMSGVLGEEDRVMILFTTNHPEEIHPGMLRPGRIHFAIELGVLDGYGLEKLAENMGDLTLSDSIKWDKLAEEFPLPPAYLKEGLNRVALYALARGDGETPVSHDDMRLALQNMLAHKTLEEAGNQGNDVPEIERALAELVETTIRNTVSNTLENVGWKVDEVHNEVV